MIISKTTANDLLLMLDNYLEINADAIEANEQNHQELVKLAEWCEDQLNNAGQINISFEA